MELQQLAELKVCRALGDNLNEMFIGVDEGYSSDEVFNIVSLELKHYNVFDFQFEEVIINTPKHYYYVSWN